METTWSPRTLKTVGCALGDGDLVGIYWDKYRRPDLAKRLDENRFLIIRPLYSEEIDRDQTLSSEKLYLLWTITDGDILFTHGAIGAYRTL